LVDVSSWDRSGAPASDGSVPVRWLFEMSKFVRLSRLDTVDGTVPVCIFS
jgi:hypothetical protein